MKIDIAFQHLVQIRKNIIKQLEKHELKAAVIPDKYNNSLIWNAAHCLVTLQLLAYKLSGNSMNVNDNIIDKYKKGTAADLENNINVNELKSMLISTAEQFQQDYKDGMFNNYSPYETSFGTTLTSIEDVILFNNVHEGLHLGYMMAMSKNL